MATLAVTTIILTAAVYVPAFVFFADDFGLDSIDFALGGGCTGFFDCLFSGTGDFFLAGVDILVFLFNLITLGGITGAVDPLLRVILLTTMGLMWVVLLLGQARGSAQQ